MLQLGKMYKLPGSDHILAELIQMTNETLGSPTGICYFAYFIGRTRRVSFAFKLEYLYHSTLFNTFTLWPATHWFKHKASQLQDLMCCISYTSKLTKGHTGFCMTVWSDEGRINMSEVWQRFNLLKPTSYVMHQQFNIQQLYVLPTLYLCVLYLSENKQRLVPLTA